MSTKTKTRTATTSQKHAQLKGLSRNTQQNIYEMLRLANEILQDHQYVDGLGGEGKLLDMLEKEEFSHFGGDPSLPAMLRAYRYSPQLETWREYRFNIRALIELAAPDSEGADATRTNWKALAKALQAELEQAKAALEEYRRTNAELRNNHEAHLGEIGELRGRLAVLESLTKNRAA